MNWYAAKGLYRHKPVNGVRRQMYEERIVLFRAESFASASVRAEQEAAEYASEGSLASFVKILDLYELDAKKSIQDSQEVYSSMYSSNLDPKRFVKTFFPDPQMDDCVKHNLRHKWFSKEPGVDGCYHCLQSRKSIVHKSVRAQQNRGGDS